MRVRYFLSLLLVGLALMGFAGYEAHIVHTREDEIAALGRRAAQLAADAAALRRDRDAANRDLTQATRELAELPAPRATDPSVSAARQAEIDQWLARVRRMRRVFEEKPEQRIPEMRYLTDEDWLRVSKSANLESDDGLRRALAALRSAAIATFTSQLGAAMRRYAFDHPGEKPASLLVLAPLFDQPVDPAIFERYEITDKVSRSFSGVKAGAWAVQNRAPVDIDFDSRFQVHIDGQNSGSSGGAGILAWMPDLDQRFKRAYDAYTTANQADPKTVAAIIPYFDPPLEPALAKLLVRTMTK